MTSFEKEYTDKKKRNVHCY